DVPVAQQLLDGADVVAVLQQMGGERVPEGVARGGLGDPGAADRVLYRPLKDRFVEVEPTTLAGDAVHVDAGGRGDPPAIPRLGPNWGTCGGARRAARPSRRHAGRRFRAGGAPARGG